jgi:hypothetical protein
MASLLVTPAGSAENAEKPLDEDLLEFLGTLDSEEEGWHDYLEQAPVKKSPVEPTDAKQVKRK